MINYAHYYTGTCHASYVEVHAGVGGDEAALFAMDLLRMYERFSSKQGWRFEMLSQSKTENGG